MKDQKDLKQKIGKTLNLKTTIKIIRSRDKPKVVELGKNIRGELNTYFLDKNKTYINSNSHSKTNSKQCHVSKPKEDSQRKI